MWLVRLHNCFGISHNCSHPFFSSPCSSRPSIIIAFIARCLGASTTFAWSSSIAWFRRWKAWDRTICTATRLTLSVTRFFAGFILVAHALLRRRGVLFSFLYFSPGFSCRIIYKASNTSLSCRLMYFLCFYLKLSSRFMDMSRLMPNLNQNS